jgi:sarcosine oxidase subunit gamma
MFSLTPHMHAGAAAGSSFSDCRNLLNAAGGALFDVSASRVGWTVRGSRAIDLLASGCPLDLHHDAFAPDSCAQSHFGHVAALYHRQVDGDFTVYVARSFAEDVWAAICSSAMQYGYEVLPEGQ